MSCQVLAVILGGAIGIMGSLGATFLIVALANRRRGKSIRAIVGAEITAIKEKAQRFIDGHSSGNGLSASSPMLASLATELGFLKPDQAIAFRRSVTLDMELRQERSMEKAKFVVEACEDALRHL